MTEAPIEASNDKEKRVRRNHTLLKMFLIVLLCSLLGTIYWFFFIRNHEWTDDAYVNGNGLMLMSPESGTAIALYADNTNLVEQGQLLVELDPTLYRLTYEEAQVQLALAARQVKQLWEDVQQRKADIELRRTEVKRTHIDFENRKKLLHTEAISQEDFTHAEADYDVSQSALHVAEHQYESAVASLGNTPLEIHPIILNAAIGLKRAYVEYMRCKIRSPAKGYIAQRSVQIGEWITPTRALMSIIPLDQIWIDANFKETQLSDIRIGQSAIITSDIYGSDVVYHGKVQGIVAGTGSIFSLLPPQNATGNWIKIVQRVPVRILLNAEEVKEHPLFLGLSIYVSIDTTDQSGLRLSEQPLYQTQFSTQIFDVPIEPINTLIEKILSENLTPPTGLDHDN